MRDSAVAAPGLIEASRGRAIAKELNRTCFCVTLDREALSTAMKAAAGDAEFYDAHVASRPHLFSSAPTFLSDAERLAMLEIVAAVEETARNPNYLETVLNSAPAIARTDLGPLGAFMSYDFHIGEGAPRLIEINTNAGGAFLNAFSARAQLACCAWIPEAQRSAVHFEENVVAMFQAEWRRQRGDGRPSRIAIVDDAPQQQFLYPEFLLARALFERHGMEAVICDAAELSWDSGVLRAAGQPVDMVYNRLVDFSFDEPRHAALRAAYLSGAVVVTPNPRNHAVFADKRNLTVLSDTELLRRWKIPAHTVAALASLPRATQINGENADSLWMDRKRLFFKPASGHGGKAVYRGDKLTRSVWADICTGDYIAQELAPPGERQVLIDGIAETRKMDVRLYTYDGALLLAAARLYQGQTTNFRTPGGGFAPVFFV
jgi:hypothetical protein